MALVWSVFGPAWKLLTEEAVTFSAEWAHHQRSGARGHEGWFWQQEGSWRERCTRGQSHSWWRWSGSGWSYSQDFGESPLKARQKQDTVVKIPALTIWLGLLLANRRVCLSGKPNSQPSENISTMWPQEASLGTSPVEEKVNLATWWPSRSVVWAECRFPMIWLGQTHKRTQRGHLSLCFPSWVQNSWRQNSLIAVVQSRCCLQRVL